MPLRKKVAKKQEKAAARSASLIWLDAGPIHRIFIRGGIMMFGACYICKKETKLYKEQIINHYTAKKLQYFVITTIWLCERCDKKHEKEQTYYAI